MGPAPDPYLGCTFWSEFRVHSGFSPICVLPEHIVVFRGVNYGSWIQLQIHIWVVLFDMNLGSTVALVPSVSLLSSLWLYVWGVRVNSGSRPGSRSIFGLYFLTWIWGPFQLKLQSHLCITWAHFVGGGFTLTPALVPSLSHLSWMWGDLLHKNVESSPVSLSTDSFLLRMIG